MARMSKLDITAITLLTIGGLNWGLVGFFDFNLVSYLLGSGLLAQLIYILVGLSAGYSLFKFPKIARRMNSFDNIAIILLIIGGLNWGLIGLVDFNLVTFIFSGLLVSITYSAVGIASVWSILRFSLLKELK